MTRVAFILAGVMTAAIAPAADAHELYLRTHAGVGYTRLSGSGAGSSERLSGPGLSLGVAIGDRLAPNLALFATAFGTALPGARYDYLSTPDPYTLTGGALYGIGVGVARSFEPSNLTVSGALAAAGWLMFNRGDGGPFGRWRSSHLGLAVQAIVGKDLWVGDAWRIGVALEIIAARMTTTTQTWTGGAASLLFAGTYD
jgi:hypothetical protein